MSNKDAFICLENCESTVSHAGETKGVPPIIGFKKAVLKQQ